MNQGRTVAWWAVLGLAAGTLMLVIQPPLAAQNPPAASPEAVSPFELSYLPETMHGFVAIRPADLLSRAEMKPFTQQMQRLLTGLVRQVGLSATVAIPIDQIEQAVGPLTLHRHTDAESAKMPNGERYSLSASCNMVRMRGEFHWKPVLLALPPLVQVKESEDDPSVFKLMTPIFGPEAFEVKLPDARTLVSGMPRKEGAPDLGPLWKSVADCGLAVWIDNRAGHWKEVLGEEKYLEAGSPVLAAVGVRWQETIQVRAQIEYADEQAAEKGMECLKALRHRGQIELKANRSADVEARVAQDLLASATMTRSGAVITLEASSGASWLDFLKGVSGAAIGIEKK